MKRPSMLIAALAATSALAWAEPPADPPAGPPRGPPIERIAQDLDLDASQTAQVRQILEAQHAKIAAERRQLDASGTRPTREEMRAKHEQMDADLRQQLSTVLSAEQLTKFEQMRKHHGPPGPPP